MEAVSEEKEAEGQSTPQEKEEKSRKSKSRVMFEEENSKDDESSMSLGGGLSMAQPPSSEPINSGPTDDAPRASVAPPTMDLDAIMGAAVAMPTESSGPPKASGATKILIDKERKEREKLEQKVELLEVMITNLEKKTLTMIDARLAESSHEVEEEAPKQETN